MNLASDEKLQELNRLIQVENDPAKLQALSEEFNRRLQELQILTKARNFPGPATPRKPTS